MSALPPIADSDADMLERPSCATSRHMQCSKQTRTLQVLSLPVSLVTGGALRSCHTVRTARSVSPTLRAGRPAGPFVFSMRIDAGAELKLSIPSPLILQSPTFGRTRTAVTCRNGILAGTSSFRNPPARQCGRNQAARRRAAAVDDRREKNRHEVGQGPTRAYCSGPDRARSARKTLLYNVATHCRPLDVTLR
jgi:hypothetical protein